jgi:hypothetical protein
MDVLAEARAALSRADEISSLPAAERASAQILQARALRAALQRVLEYHEGFAAEHHRLISLVFALLGTVESAHVTRPDRSWASFLGRGTVAVAFRRALNELVEYMHTISRPL